MKATKWTLRENTYGKDELARALNLSPVVAQILLNRGISSIQEAKAFLYCEGFAVPNPQLLTGMDAAVTRICQALDHHQPITIYGDYDVDGQTATALLYRFFRELAPESPISYYIPHRMDEGYGLNSQAIQQIAAKSKLLVTVDCGISSFDEVGLANELGLDVIITDHHEPGEQLPNALAVINPKVSLNKYPYQHLAGVGVAYKLCQALGKIYQLSPEKYLDLVALGTVADLVPLTEENRVYVRRGLKQFASTANLGLQALLKVCSIQKPTAKDLGFRLGPRLNAVGRMGVPGWGVELLLTEDSQEAERLANLLDEENRSRQNVEADILAQAVEQVETRGGDQEPAIVVAGENWHPGVIGIVASRLVGKYFRPTVVIGIEAGEGKGSARSISGFHLFDALKQCDDLLTKFGGHEMAAGLTIPAHNIPEFRERLKLLADEVLTEEDYVPKVQIDAKLHLAQINEELINQLNLLEPCGMGNPSPVLQVAGSLLTWQPIGNGQHFKGYLQESGEQMEVIGFGLRETLEEYEGSREQLELLVEPKVNEYRRQRNLQLQVSQLKAGVSNTSYVGQWMLKYPWQLPEHFYQIGALRVEKGQIAATNLAEESVLPNVRVCNQQGTWNKEEYICKQFSLTNNVLIYVNTPAQALDVCRSLRIKYPGEKEHIGFEHEYLSPAERVELHSRLAEGSIRWLVSTGSGWINQPWSDLVLYYPPVHPQLIRLLRCQLVEDATCHLLYSRQDVLFVKRHIQEALPERGQLARFYRGLTSKRQTTILREHLIEVAQGCQMRFGVDFALQVFAELGLVSINQAEIGLLPPPEDKLDLHSSVLYNEGMDKRQQYLVYLQNCFERGVL